MITQQQAETWIIQHGIEQARELCLAIECYCVGDCDGSELCEFLSDVYRDGHKGTSNFTEQDCVRMISGDGSYFADEEEQHTMDELIQVVGDYYAPPVTAEQAHSQLFDQLHNQQNAISNLVEDSRSDDE